MCMRVGGCERVNVRLINIVELNEIRGISIYDKFKNIYLQASEVLFIISKIARDSAIFLFFIRKFIIFIVNSTF